MTHNSDLRRIGADAAATSRDARGRLDANHRGSPHQGYFCGGPSGPAARAHQHCRIRRVRCWCWANLCGAARDRPDHRPGQLWRLRLRPGLGDTAGVLLDIGLPRLSPTFRAGLSSQRGVGVGPRRYSVFAATRRRHRDQRRPNRILRDHRFGRLDPTRARPYLPSRNRRGSVSGAASHRRFGRSRLRRSRSGSRTGASCPRRSIAGDHCGRILGKPIPSRCHSGDGGDAPQLRSHARSGPHLLAPAASAGPRQ